MRWIALLVVMLGCESEPRHKITKTMTMTNLSGCVDSDQASCVRPGREWTHGKCCAVTSCMDGTEAACVRGGGEWTRGTCCFSQRMTFRPGDEAECVRTRGTWTGALCTGQ